VHRNDCIAKTASQSLQRQDCTARVHRKECIAKTASQLFQQLGLVLNGAVTKSAAKRNKPLAQRHAIAATLIGRCSTMLSNRHHGHAKKASFDLAAKGRRTAMLTSQASRRRARRHRSAASFGHADHDSHLQGSAELLAEPIAASASSSAASQAIDLVRGDCKAAALATVSCVDPVKGDSKTETYHQKLTTLLVLTSSKDFLNL
jgi:hypothetical protein